MQEIDENDGMAVRRLRCVQQITEADDETLHIVSAVLDRARPIAKAAGRKRGRPARSEAGKGGGA